jgi:hypothetical protein
MVKNLLLVSLVKISKSGILDHFRFWINQKPYWTRVVLMLLFVVLSAEFEFHFSFINSECHPSQNSMKSFHLIYDESHLRVILWWCHYL